MPVIRFVREGLEVECYPGENLRDVALRQGVEIYGLKGKLGNCNGCGQCITCFVGVVAEAAPGALSDRTAVEDQKLRKRPQDWRLACQTLVLKSVTVLTRPQVGLADGAARLEAARQAPLAEGPTEWPEVSEPEGVEESQSAEATDPSA
ncbi:2Fe-2S iron-sulfur cluster-binding protein [Cyanobium sp. ATX 6F1]|uniref:2Fe-2S iron-sulfur cluster-binding protein n=1 Tax=unclassified Cyanobium TaxID=2627006 RepID=UPI0020CF21ED|nr:2Fe-2S iron-sulfur cluster-binding protein [Cyanobium sp. ATX 6F1]MCP9917179.1 (2Fe-2S)-binding protein [Cyanobium sp. ATX 6F1]